MDRPIPLTVYTAPGCCLCDDAHRALGPLGSELGLAVEWVDISEDEGLEAAWRQQIPAGVMDGRKVFKYRVDEQLLRRRVAAMRARDAAVAAADPGAGPLRA